MILAALLLAAHPVEPETAVEAEIAFAADAQTLGQWTAFAKWADEEGVLVGRTVVDAREFASSQEDPEHALRWWPVLSYLNCNGDLAINIGGWKDPESGQAGQFHTVWKKGDEGWRYLVDIGATRKAALNKRETVEIVRASCDAPVNFLMAVANAVAKDTGVSDDRSLHWRWSIGENGAGEFSFAYWNGAAFQSHTIRLPAPESTE